MMLGLKKGGTLKALAIKCGIDGFVDPPKFVARPCRKKF